MAWKSTLFILFLAALTVAVCAQNGRRGPDDIRRRGRPSDRPGSWGGPGGRQTEANLEQRGGGRRDGGRRNEGRSRPGEQFSDGQERQGVEGGEGAEFGGPGGFRRRGGKPFFGQGGRQEEGRQGGPDGDMSPMSFGGGRRSDRANETDGDESFPGRHHGRHHSRHHHHHQHHHGRRNESEESEEGDNNGTSIFPFRFGRHGNRRHHHVKCNESEEYDGEEDNNDTRISDFEDAPFGRPSRRRHHPCKRNRTEEENEISDRGDRRDQSGRDGGRRGEGGNGHPFQRPGNGGRPFGRRGDRKPDSDDEDMSTTISTRTEEVEIEAVVTDIPEVNDGFLA
ncbi:uncharacterized protein [Diadema antillarum]|uniref:uncharacterized protein n=1 Tax=Diadema antillarum TaxID=105358 RepID=UPI003A889427